MSNSLENIAVSTTDLLSKTDEIKAAISRGQQDQNFLFEFRGVKSTPSISEISKIRQGKAVQRSIKKSEEKRDKKRYYEKAPIPVMEPAIEMSSVDQTIDALQQIPLVAEAIVKKSIAERDEFINEKNEDNFNTTKKILEQLLGYFQAFHKGWGEQTAFEQDFGRALQGFIKTTNSNMNNIFVSLRKMNDRETVEVPLFQQGMITVNNHLDEVRKSVESLDGDLGKSITAILTQADANQKSLLGAFETQKQEYIKLGDHLQVSANTNEKLSESISKQSNFLRSTNDRLKKLEKQFLQENNLFERMRADITMSDAATKEKKLELERLRQEYDTARTEVVQAAMIIQNLKEEQNVVSKDMENMLSQTKTMLAASKETHEKMDLLNTTIVGIKNADERFKVSLDAVNTTLNKRFDEVVQKIKVIPVGVPPPPTPPDASGMITLGFGEVTTKTQESFSAVQAQFNTLNNTMNSFQTALNGFGTKINTNQNAIIALSASITAMENNMNKSFAAMKERPTEMIIDPPVVPPFDYQRLEESIKSFIPRPVPIDMSSLANELVSKITPVSIDYEKIGKTVSDVLFASRPDVSMAEATSSQVVPIAPDYKNMDLMFDAYVQAISKVFEAQLQSALSGVNTNLNSLSKAIANRPIPVVTLGTLDASAFPFGNNREKHQFSYFRSFTLDWYNSPGISDLMGMRTFKSLAAQKSKINQKHGLVQNPSNEPDPWVNPQYHQAKIRTQPLRKAIKAGVRRKKIGFSSRNDYLF